MSFFKKLFGFGSSSDEKISSDESDLESLRKITAKLQAMDPQEARYHALFACLLSRVAYSDLTISDEETQKMEDLLIRRGFLQPTVAALVVEIAKVQNQILGGVENFLITQEFLKISNLAQRKLLLECLFAVASADDHIVHEESEEIRQIAQELKVEQQDFIAVRLKFKQYLAVLKNEDV